MNAEGGGGKGSRPAPRAVVFVFAKPPRPGETKSRLAATIGEEAAARLAGAFLADIWDVVHALPWAEAMLAATVPEVSAYGLGEVPWVLQGQGDLSERMERVLRVGLERAGVVMLVGADCPGITEAAFEAARDTLDAGADAFLVPVTDGGFCLVAVTRCPAGLFEGVPWSVATTAEDAMSRMRALGMAVRAGEHAMDVDDAAGLEVLRGRIAAGVVAARRTADVLRGIAGVASDPT